MFEISVCIVIEICDNPKPSFVLCVGSLEVMSMGNFRFSYNGMGVNYWHQLCILTEECSVCARVHVHVRGRACVCV